MTMSSEQYQRYARHLTLPEFGEVAQEKLLASSVLLIGAGGLGAPLAFYLAAAGVGRIGIVDFDVVDVSNLQRQIIHRMQDVGTSKARSAERGIKDINPDTIVEVHETNISADNAMELVANYDIVIDGTDNFPTRYLVNDACVFLKKINIYGSIYRFEGQATVFDAQNGPCYRCLYPEPPEPGMVPSCSEGGVLGVLPGYIAMIQATEAIKILTGIGKSLVGRFIRYDALNMETRELKLRKDPECPVCGANPSITELIDYEQFCGLTRGGDDGSSIGVKSISVDDYADMRDDDQEHLLLDVREDHELKICMLEPCVHIPLGQINQRYDEIAEWKDKPVIVICKAGQRSQKAGETLMKHGFNNIANLSGGIIAYAEEIDNSLASY